MKQMFTLAAAAAAVSLLAGCNGEKPAEQKAAPAAEAAAVIIYSNADEEAQKAMKNALDANGMKGLYKIQGLGTSELGGKLAAEGKNIEADVVTTASYYLDSLQKSQKLFQKLAFTPDTINPTPDYYAPILGNCGALFVNTEVLKADGLKAPTSIEELADPVYAGHISVPDITGSSTSWLMTQAMIAAKGEEAGAAVIRQIEKNAGAHLEKSGSAPLKKIRAGEVAVGFGLRHQAVADKADGLPIDYVDPTEGNFSLTESVAVLDKGEDTNPLAIEMARCIIENGRAELIQTYPNPLYEGETADPANQSDYPSIFDEPLTFELFTAHQELSERAKG